MPLRFKSRLPQPIHQPFHHRCAEDLVIVFRFIGRPLEEYDEQLNDWIESASQHNRHPARSMPALDRINRGFARADHIVTRLRRRLLNRECSRRLAYTETGVVIPATVAVSFDAVARYTLDAEGNLEGTATSSSGGTIANVTLKGSGTVNPDCASVLTVGVYSGSTLIRTITFDVVYIDNARGARALVTSLVLANGTTVPAYSPSTP